MEEKLLKLFKAVNIYTERNKKNYAEFEYNANLKKIRIDLRDKGSHEFKETAEFSVLENDLFNVIEEIIKKLEG